MFSILLPMTSRNCPSSRSSFLRTFLDSS